MIDRNTIEQIMDAAKIEEVVSDFVALRRRGVNLIGLCPFHNEKTPSFTVSQYDISLQANAGHLHNSSARAP